MPVREWSHMCDYATIDMKGHVSVIGIFELVFAPSLPAVHPLMYVVSRWSGEPGEQFTYAVRIIFGSDGSNVLMATKGFPVTIKQAVHAGSAEIRQATTITPIAGLRFPFHGRYTIDILTDDIVVHTIPFWVEKPPQKLNIQKINNKQETENSP